MSLTCKEGKLLKWSESKRKYVNVYVKLLNSGWLQWFETQQSTSPKKSVDIKNVFDFLAFGRVISQVPNKPQTMTDSDMERSFGVPYEPSKNTKLAFFMCSNPGELSSWIDAVSHLFSGESQRLAGTDFITPQQAPQTVESGNYGYPPVGVGYPGVHSGGYPGMPQTGFSESGYPPQQPAGYPLASTAYLSSEPQPYSASVYPPAPGGYPPLQAGGYPTPQAGGYPPPQAGGYPPPQAGGYPPPQAGGYPPPQSRVPQSVAGGYPAQASGYGIPMAAGAAMGAGGLSGQQQPYLLDKKGKPYTIIYKDGKPKKKKWKKAALGGATGLAAGAAGGYLAGKMFGGLGRMGGMGYGGGWGGGWGGHGMGRKWGSWSSLSSFSGGSWSS